MIDRPVLIETERKQATWRGVETWQIGSDPFGDVVFMPIRGAVSHDGSHWILLRRNPDT